MQALLPIGSASCPQGANVVALGIMPPPRSQERDAAIAAGLTRYQGAPCKNGHPGERFTSNGACVECASTAAAEANVGLYAYKAEKGYCTNGLPPGHKKPKKGRFCAKCLKAKREQRRATYADRVVRGVCVNSESHEAPVDGSVHCEACKEASRAAYALEPAERRYCRNNDRHDEPEKGKALCKECREKNTPASRIARGRCAKWGGEKHPRPIVVDGKRKKICEQCIAREIKRQKRVRAAKAA